MAPLPPPAMAASLLLLLLLCAATSAAVTPPPLPPPPPPTTPPPPPPGPLTQLRGALGQAGAVAGDFLGRLSLPSAQEKIRNAYETGAAAVLTYTGILTDQLYHWWRGEQ